MHKRKNIWENRRERDTAKILKYPRISPFQPPATPPYLMSFAPTNRHPTEALPSPHHLVATPSISWVVPQHWGPASQWGVNQVHTWFTNVEGGAFKDMYTCLGTPTGADITSLTEEQCVACCGEEGRDLYEAWQQALPSFDPRGNACVGGGWGVAWRATCFACHAHPSHTHVHLSAPSLTPPSSPFSTSSCCPPPLLRIAPHSWPL